MGDEIGYLSFWLYPAYGETKECLKLKLKSKFFSHFPEWTTINIAGSYIMFYFLTNFRQ